MVIHYNIFVFSGEERKLISAHVEKIGQGGTDLFIGELEPPVIIAIIASL